ncbi:hypothetical protein GQ44DRAFT_607252 [Phaeosphaeriaceae sp. PMI808]|nr:hypothetical protein GQ44DRAFT_607252 [Phaeosphaeriaceae sp. PMI808]
MAGTNFNPADFAAQLSQTDFTLVAQTVMCAYPISDVYAPTPRYLYYCLLVLTFVTIRHRWFSNIFLGAAVAYAATAAIHSFILASNESVVQDAQNVSMPLILPTSNLTGVVKSLVTNTSILGIQPDAVELDIDPITAVVVSAYLVGLPLQVWSRTMRSSAIFRNMIILWNIFMGAGAICALVSWPKVNLNAPQYRFCFAGVLDPDTISNDGWDNKYWQGSFNSSIGNIFNTPGITWQSMSSNCYYPCFNTSQVIRQATSLKAVVTTPDTRFAKLHNPNRYGQDEFRPMVYFAIILFSSAQAFLYLVSILNLGSEALRTTINEPTKAWEKRDRVWEQLRSDASRSFANLKHLCSLCIPARPRSQKLQKEDELSSSASDASSPPKLVREDMFVVFRLVIDVIALITVIAGLTLFPVVIIAFICWIEWYIRNDGDPTETPGQVGQWTPLVSVAVILFATLLYQLQLRMASDDEVRWNMRDLEMKLRELRGELERRSGVMENHDELELVPPLSRGSTLEKK